MSGQMIGPMGVAPASSAAPFALEAGSVKDGNTGAGTTFNITGVNTVYSNCRVYIAMVNNGGAPSPPTGAGISFTQRCTSLNGASTVTLYEGLAASPLVNASFAITQASSDFMTGLVVAFSGGKVSSPYDANAPAAGLNGSGGTFTTAPGNGIIVAVGVINTNIDSPYAPLSSTAVTNFLSFGYRSVSGATATAAVWGGNTTSINCALDALVQGP